MNYTQAQIDRANAVSLEDFLRTQGETLIKSGREYRWKEHDSLTVRGNKWFRHSQSKGGYPIDFVMEFYGKSFPEAVQLLTGESGEGQTEASTAPPTAFHLPLHNRTADRAIQYLCESRGLNTKLVEAFLLSGDIYEDAKRHNVVFVGRDRNGTPRYGTENLSAYLRKMAVDGYVVQLDLPELKELVSLMRYSSNNLNQLTRKVHETGRVYDADLEDISQRQEQLWEGVKEILTQLSKLS